MQPYFLVYWLRCAAIVVTPVGVNVLTRFYNWELTVLCLVSLSFLMQVVTFVGYGIDPRVDFSLLKIYLWLRSEGYIYIFPVIYGYCNTQENLGAPSRMSYIACV